MSPRILTDHERRTLEREFLTDDLGREVTVDGRVTRRPRRAPESDVTKITRQLTRTLYGLRNNRTDPIVEAVVAAVVTTLDGLVISWGRRNSPIPPLTVDGIRAAARIVADAAERVGLTMPTSPRLDQPAGGWPYPPSTPADLDPDEDDPTGDDLNEPGPTTVEGYLFDPPGGTR